MGRWLVHWVVSAGLVEYFCAWVHFAVLWRLALLWVLVYYSLGQHHLYFIRYTGRQPAYFGSTTRSYVICPGSAVACAGTIYLCFFTLNTGHESSNITGMPEPKAGGWPPQRGPLAFPYNYHTNKYFHTGGAYPLTNVQPEQCSFYGAMTQSTTAPQQSHEFPKGPQCQEKMTFRT